MLKKIIFFSLVVISLITDVKAMDRFDIGFSGIYDSEPGGVACLNGRYLFNGMQGVNVNLGWQHDMLIIYTDYQFRYGKEVKIESAKFKFYYGIGSRVIFQDKPHIGIRFPLELDYDFERLPLCLFSGLALGLDITPETEMMLNLCLGLRWKISL